MQEVAGRYDYLPFGEEVYEGRSGYGGDSVRRRFTGTSGTGRRI